MDQSLDELISQRPERAPRGGRRQDMGRGPPVRAPRAQAPSYAPRSRDDYGRDGARKYPSRRDEPGSIDSDWVHDRFEDERYDRIHARVPPDTDRYAPVPRYVDEGGAKLRVDNVHYDLTEEDLRGLFEQKGPTISVKLLYDRMDRSEGTAFVTYEDTRDARRAIADFDGCNANGQPIKVTLLPTGPAAASAPRGFAAHSEPSLFDRMDRPERSLFDRMAGPEAREDDRQDFGRNRRRRERSDSPRRNVRNAVPDHIDRYVPGSRDSRSPIGRRGTPRGSGSRETGRRGGARYEDGGRGGGRRRPDDGGRPPVGGRPKKTAQELDDEMADYWGKTSEDTPNATNGSARGAQNGSGMGGVEEDTDMVL